VVTAGYEAMGKVSHGRTHAVVNEAEAPTSAFILDPDAKFPGTSMKEKISDEVGRGATHYIDATRLATQLLGDSIAANLFLLGFAWQRGLVPVSAAALEQAIELNGVAVDFNRRAFLWGRRCAHQPEKVLALVEALSPAPRPRLEGFEEIVADRIARLTRYQDAAYARRYLQHVQAVRAADPRGGEAESVSVAAAHNLYRLMACKDEYEVARLYTDGEFLRSLEQQFDGDYQLRFHLAPPLLARRDPDTGLPLKREYGPWMLRAFGWLARLRRLRGTPLDIFGRTAERKRERQDIAAYADALETICRELREDNYAAALELARLPAKLRGFGHVKDRNRELLAPRRQQLLAQLRGEVHSAPVKVVDAA